MTRFERLGATLEDPLLVTTPVNVRYLTGFESTNAALLVARNSVRLFTDFRYAEAARQVSGVEFVETERNILRGISRVVSGRVAFEAAHVTYAGWELLKDAGLELVPTTSVVERLRAVKDEDELEAIRAASVITNEAYERIAEQRFVGRSERELGFAFDAIQQELGAHANAFPTVVASGPNAAVPHHHSTDRVIGKDETVVIDAGASVNGYASDCTRTFATGTLPDELRHAYDVCLEAQVEGLANVVVGVSGRDADAGAREVIAGAGLGEYFGHGLGHGVGLMVHEAPVLRPESEDVLVENNVVTVEPGIYLPGVGGVRIEDLVVVRENEPVVLTSFTKELVTVG